jgi:hypothetical protein
VGCSNRGGQGKKKKNMDTKLHKVNGVLYPEVIKRNLPVRRVIEMFALEQYVASASEAEVTSVGTGAYSCSRTEMCAFIRTSHWRVRGGFTSIKLLPDFEIVLVLQSRRLHIAPIVGTSSHYGQAVRLSFDLTPQQVEDILSEYDGDTYSLF